MFSKDTWRQLALAGLKTAAREYPQKKGLADDRLCQRLLAHPAYRTAQTVATYLSLPHEVDTSTFVSQALAQGKQVVVPKVLGPGQMVFVTYRPDQLVQSSLGIWEPQSEQEVPASAIDFLHVPGLLFNEAGFRIGYGGGFYDRYLATYEGPSLATLYRSQLVDFVPAPHDLAVKELMLDETMDDPFSLDG